eukprot:CAMPEP_0202386212 /NCGR_PEP_ID=MMETSP1127-20130417/65201_1 /ASSEMBLY_ACC=CAM_ASM_000462 /TAXON_ID=3047 /ORGANISM="Dunaliella tertiolecta, Strain CCMP1320" /LENGTH=307 /DNA_ID=CAMNT_0048986653 /DNA_START=248 /DNA_END=1171 /DNA_ORIENTATION=-
MSPGEALDSRFIVVEELNKQVAFPSKRHPTLTLTLAKPSPWTQANHMEHCRADAVFGAGVREFLKAHNRLRRHPELQLQQERLQLGPTTRSKWKLIQQVLWPKCACCLWPKSSSSIGAQSAPTLPSRPCMEDVTTSSGAAGPPSLADRAFQESAGQRPRTTTGQGSPRGSTNLGDLPFDLILDIISHWAPPVVPDVLPVVPADMEDEEGGELEEWSWDIQDGQAFVQPGLVWMAEVAGMDDFLQIQMAQNIGGNEGADDVWNEGAEVGGAVQEPEHATQQETPDSDNEEAEEAWVEDASQFGSAEEP